ncbi:hypothetical protein H6P81_003103 [Aristolochia fimbriata]|uniref:Uncharacterized protein n=1 Tax=Aristolochia fimbriata TaxID=158543 RepID=A0AAV7FBM8_ARIFI|nr:hypothetical protein H6P81_003103 [Aristolochia fimbriata]
MRDCAEQDIARLRQIPYADARDQKLRQRIHESVQSLISTRPVAVIDRSLIPEEWNSLSKQYFLCFFLPFSNCM